MSTLEGKIAVVTGASRGIGKGIALGLAEQGATVYVTGRTIEEGSAPLPGTIGATAEEVNKLGGKGIAVRCDHGNDDEIQALFEQVKSEQGGLDILVNNVFKVPNPPVWSGEFWTHPISIWDDMVGIGLRAHYVASVHAAPMLVERKGLLVNISSPGAGSYFFSTAYGVGKCGVDRMAADMAIEFKRHGVAALALWPGAVKTEFVLDQAEKAAGAMDLSEAESPLFTGRAVASLALDPNVMEKTGRTHIVAELSKEYGFEDVRD